MACVKHGLRLSCWLKNAAQHLTCSSSFCILIWPVQQCAPPWRPWWMKSDKAFWRPCKMQSGCNARAWCANCRHSCCIVLSRLRNGEMIAWWGMQLRCCKWNQIAIRKKQAKDNGSHASLITATTTDTSTTDTADTADTTGTAFTTDTAMMASRMQRSIWQIHRPLAF